RKLAEGELRLAEDLDRKIHSRQASICRAQDLEARHHAVQSPAERGEVESPGETEDSLGDGRCGFRPRSPETPLLRRESEPLNVRGRHLHSPAAFSCFQ